MAEDSVEAQNLEKETPTDQQPQSGKKKPAQRRRIPKPLLRYHRRRRIPKNSRTLRRRSTKSTMSLKPSKVKLLNNLLRRKKKYRGKKIRMKPQNCFVLW